MRNLQYILLVCLLNITSLSLADIPDGYYTSANGLKKAALKAALHSLMQPKTVLSYGSGSGSTWSGFYQTDRTSNNQVIDRYSNEVHTFSNTTSAVSGMNIEHSFPKSWWGGSKNNAYQDLFNLMPCESSINSSKSNYAMGKVTNAKTDNGCTKVGTGMAGSTSTNLWEPADKWKGDFARGYMYMATCYSDFTWVSGPATIELEQDDWPTLRPWAYELLLEWSRQDPVDDIEKARNEAVYKIQGNRNPYVDYPNLCEYVWGDSIDYAWSMNGSKTDPTPDPDPQPEDEVAVIDSIAFTAGWDGWTVNDVNVSDPLTYVWTQTSSYGMKASAFYNSTNYAAESWLISPEYDLTDYQSAVASFSHTGKYFESGVDFDSQKMAVFKVTDDDGASWYDEKVNTWMTGSNWTYVVNTTSLDNYSGSKIRVAFCYSSSESAAPTWEIKYFTLKGVKKSTGVKSITSASTNSGKTYGLDGREWPATAKGVVIRNGKKYLQK